MIRELRDCDIPAIAELELVLFGVGAWNEAIIRQELAAPARTYRVDVSEHSPDVIRGYGGLWCADRDAELMTLGVAPKWRRRGVARRLLGELIAAAAAQSARRMLLEVRVDNDAAIALYRSFGFQRIGFRRGYYQPENVDAYTMAARIGQESGDDE